MRRYLLAVLACALTGQAKPNDSGRVLVLLGKSLPQYQQVATAFAEEWKQGTGIEPVVMQFPNDDAQKRQLLSPRPALVVGLGEAPTVWALGRQEEFPLGFSMVVAPERLDGFARMLSTKKRTMQGVSIEVSDEKQLEILRKLMPQLKRIGVITTTVALRDNVSRLRQACEKDSIQLSHVELSSLAELPAKLGAMLGEVDLLWSLPDPEIFQPQLAQHIISECAQRKVALLGLSATFVRSGATLSFDRDYTEVGKSLARKCLRSKSGTCDDLPLESTRNIVLSINSRSFQALNLNREIKLADVVVNKF